MSTYELSKALYRLTEPAQRNAFLADPDAYVAQLTDLDATERRMLVEADANGLVERGVSIYLIRTLEIIGKRTLVDTGLRTGGQYPRIVRNDG